MSNGTILKTRALKAGTQRIKDLGKAAQKVQTQVKKAAPVPPKKAATKVVAPLKKAAQAAPKFGSQIKKVAPKRFIGKAAGYRRSTGEALWLPNTKRPAWLDGSLPGDRGFDPLGLSKPAEYLQFDSDSLDQNKAVNKAGNLVGAFAASKNKIDAARALAPYDDVFGLQRFRENELIHGRWAMLAALGAIVGEASTGVSWVDAGKVELDGAQYLGFRLPFTISQLVWIEAILVGIVEVYRNGESDPERRLYPGGPFDPLKLASDNSDRAFRLKEAEIKHARLAMIAFLGYGVQGLTQGEGALGSLAKFASGLGARRVAEALTN